MTDAHFIGTVRDGVAWAQFNRPESYNAWSEGMREGLADFLHRCQSDSAVRCLVLSGAGRHFMAGGDVKSFAPRLEAPSAERAESFAGSVRDLNPVVEMLQRLSVPTITMVQGACAGLGFSFLLASDLAIAADNAYFTFAYTRIGATPDGGAGYYLPRIVGMKRAMQIALLCDRMPAEEAEALGLVNWVVPQAELEQRGEALARRIADGAVRAMGRTKRLLRQAGEASLTDLIEQEALAFGACAADNELREGVAAFLEKRPTRFREV